MKRLKLFIGWMLWGFVSLYVAAILLLRLGAVQSWVGHEVAAVLIRTLQTSVEVGRINIGLGGRVVIDGVEVLDQSRQRMLSVGRLSCKIDLLPLLAGRVSIASAGLFGAHAWLRKDEAEAAPNFQFIIDRLSSRDSTGGPGLNLHIGSLIVRRSGVSWQENYLPTTPGCLNVHHLNVSGISAHVAVKTLTPDSMNIYVKRIAFDEGSQLKVKRLTARVEAGNGGWNVCRFELSLPHSELKISQLDNFTISQFHNFTDFTISQQAQPNCQIVKSSNCQINRGLSNCQIKKDCQITALITPCDLAPLLPALGAYNEPVGLDATVENAHGELRIKSLHLKANGLMLEGDAALRGKAWRARIGQLAMSEAFIALMANRLHLPNALRHLGRVTLTAEAKGEGTRELSGSTHIATEAGQAQAAFALSPHGSMRLQLSTPGLQVGQVAGVEGLGLVAGKLTASGTLHHFDAQATLSRLDFKGYSYQQIEATAQVARHQKRYQGHLKIDDPQLQLNLSGLWQQARRHSLQIDGQLGRINPHALHLTGRWPGASFSANIHANFTASSLGDAVGETAITQAAMTDSTGVYTLSGIHVKSGYSGGQHYLLMNSDFGDLDLSGPFDWGTLPQSVMAYVKSHLPSLPGLPREIRATHNQFRLNAHLTDSRPLQKLLGIPLVLHQPLTLYMAVNDSNRRMDLHATAPAFTLGGNSYTGAVMSLTSPADTMLCRISADREGTHPTHLQVDAAAAADHLQTSLRWDNHNPLRTLRGELNADAQLYENEQGKGEARVELRPSLMTVGNSLWTISSSDIIYSDRRLELRSVAARHDQQFITLDGVASASSGDTLTIGLGDVDISYVLDLVGFHSVEFAGAASGKAYLAGAFSQPQAWANLSVSHFTFEQGRMGTLYATAKWNNAEGQIDIGATAIDGPDAMTTINGYVSPKRNCIDLDIGARGTYIDFMHSFTDNFLSTITGHAQGDVKLSGPLSHMNLTGQLLVSGQADVTALGTSYTLKGDSVTFVPDDIRLQHMRVADRNGHTATLSGGIHHKHLTSLSFDLDVDADNMLAYDFHDFGQNTFYGTVYASGHVDLHGRPGETVINCNVTPRPYSTLTYNADADDATTTADFITWGKAHSSTEGDSVATAAPDSNAREVPSDLRINFLVNATPDATLRLLMDAGTNDYITLHGSGTINATYYNKGPFQMFGTYTVADGTYGVTLQNIIKKNFNFQSGGTIQFGGDPFEAALHLKAAYTVNGVSLSDLNIGNSFSKNTIRVNCLMNILGQAGAPRVEFDLEMPTVNAEEAQMIRSIIASGQETNQQVVYLLGVGRFYNPTASQNAQAGQYGQTQLAMQSLLSGTVSSQINEVLSQVVPSDNWNFGANISTGDEGWHNAEYEGIVSGRMLNNRLLINGQFGYRDNAAQANTSFIGDFDIRYLLTPNGNLALKVYNQTNDRYFTRSSLNTQGIGLIMKKDFDSLRPLFGRKKKKNKM